MAPAFELPLTSLEGYVPASYLLPLMGSDPDFCVPALDVSVSSSFDPSFDPAAFEYFCSRSLFSSQSSS
jgi:hypothetical protein